MSELEEVLREFSRISKSYMGEPTTSYADRHSMAKEIVTLREQLQAVTRERDVYASTCTELELKERELERENTELRTNALNIAFSYGQIDGDHHKSWVIDQMVRALLGNDMEYTKWVKEYCMDGEYEWDEGIAP